MLPYSLMFPLLAQPQLQCIVTAISCEPSHPWRIPGAADPPESQTHMRAGVRPVVEDQLHNQNLTLDWESVNLVGRSDCCWDGVASSFIAVN